MLQGGHNILIFNKGERTEEAWLYLQNNCFMMLQSKPTTNPILPAPLLCLIFVQKYTK